MTSCVCSCRVTRSCACTGLVTSHLCTGSASSSTMNTWNDIHRTSLQCCQQRKEFITGDLSRASLANKAGYTNPSGCIHRLCPSR